MPKTKTTAPVFAKETALFKNLKVGNANISVLIGQPERLLVEEITKNLPFSKILFVQTINMFFSLGLKLIKKLKSCGIKVINVIIDENDSLSVDSVCGVFCVSEEVRGVVALGEAAFDAAKYYSSVCGAKYYAVANEILSFDAVNPRLNIKNGNKIDVFSAPKEQVIIIDEKTFLESDASLPLVAFLTEGYFSIMDAELSKSLSFDDYCAVKKEYSRLVDVCFLSCADSFRQNLLKIFELLLIFSKNFYDRLNGSTCVNCLSVVDFLYYGGFKNDKMLKIKAALKYFEIYEKVKNEQVCFSTFDFNERVKAVKNLSGLGENALLESLILQQRKLAEKSKNNVFEEIMGLWKLKKMIYLVGFTKVYDKQKFSSAIKHSGDTTLNINFASFLRHLGGMEEV